MMMGNYIPVLSILISLAGVLCSIYVANQSVKNRDVDTLKKEVKRDTEISVKLDNIMSATIATDKKIEKLETKIDSMNQENVALKHDVSALTARMDKFENRLELLHKEHREHMAKFEAE